MSDWQTIRFDAVSKEEPKRVDRGHAFTTPKRVPWLKFCRSCGHIPLRNAISEIVSKAGCGYETDVRYLAWRKAGKKA